MNPAALKVNVPDLEDGGTIIINTDGFTPGEFEVRQLTRRILSTTDRSPGYRVHRLPISTLNMNALKGVVQLTRKEMDRSKNFFALGVLYWLYDRPIEPTIKWINAKFGKNPELAKANEIAVKTGYNFADTTEVFTTHYTVKKAQIAPGKYRKITGNEATALGFVAASQLPDDRCSTVRIQLRPRRTFCTSWRVTRVSALRRFRPKTRSRPFARRSAPALPATSV